MDQAAVISSSLDPQLIRSAASVGRAQPPSMRHARAEPAARHGRPDRLWLGLLHLTRNVVRGSDSDLAPYLSRSWPRCWLRCLGACPDGLWLCHGPSGDRPHRGGGYRRLLGGRTAAARPIKPAGLCSRRTLSAWLLGRPAMRHDRAEVVWRSPRRGMVGRRFAMRPAVCCDRVECSGPSQAAKAASASVRSSPVRSRCSSLRMRASAGSAAESAARATPTRL